MAEGDVLGQSLATATAENDGATESTQSTETASSSGEGLNFDGLDEKDRGKLARFKSQNQLAKSYLELERRLGSSVMPPGQNATPEERAAFYEKLGRPKSSDEYKFDPVFLPDGVTRAEFGEADYKKIAHQVGLTQEQAKALHKWSADQSLVLLRENKRQFDEKKRASAEALQREHGDRYKEKLARIDKLNRKFGGDGWIEYLNRGAGNDPEMLRFLITLGDAISEDTLEAGRPVPGGVPSEPGVLQYDRRPELTGENRMRQAH